MNINLKEYYYNKFLNYAINKNWFKSFKKNEDSIRESINKIVDDNNDFILTEAFVYFLTTDDLYMHLEDLATNDKYLMYELISSYYQDIIKCFEYSSIEDITIIQDKTITNYLDLNTKSVLEKVNLFFIDISRTEDISIFDFVLMRSTIFYILAYCHINKCMDKYDDLIKYYRDDIYKMRDEMIIYGIEDLVNNKELIDIVSRGLINKNKRIIK